MTWGVSGRRSGTCSSREHVRDVQMLPIRTPRAHLNISDYYHRQQQPSSHSNCGESTITTPGIKNEKLSYKIMNEYHQDLPSMGRNLKINKNPTRNYGLRAHSGQEEGWTS